MLIGGTGPGRFLLVSILLATGLAGNEVRAQELASAHQLGLLSDVSHSLAVIDTLVDTNDNIWAFGTFSGTIDFDPGPGSHNLSALGARDAFILELDSAGAFRWLGQLGGPGASVGLFAATLTSTGVPYLAGTFSGGTVDFDPGPGVHNLAQGAIFVSRLDGNGNLVWIDSFDPGTFSLSNEMLADGDTSLNLLGNFSGTIDLDPGPGVFPLSTTNANDGFILKLDAAGAFLWAKQIVGVSGSFPWEDWNGQDTDPAGNLYITGNFYGTVDFDPGPDVHSLTADTSGAVFLLKLDAQGDFKWVEPFLAQFGYGLSVDSNSDTYLTGRFAGAVDFDPGAGVYQLVSSSADCFVVKLAADGSLVWAKQFKSAAGPSNSGTGVAVTTDINGDVLVTGYFFGTVDFDTSVGAYPLTSAGSRDFFFTRLDGSGSFISAARSGGPNDDGGRRLFVSSQGNVTTLGTFSGTVDFDPGPGVYNLTSVNASPGSDVFITEFRRCPTFLDQSTYGLLLFPPQCTRSSATLAQDSYATMALAFSRGPNDRFYLASDGMHFAPLVADDLVHVNGIDSGLGPYSDQPGVPPFPLDVPIERNLVPLPAKEVTSALPLGLNTNIFELLDSDRTIYGNTAVYLVRDCGIVSSGNNPISLRWISHDDEIAGTSPQFDARYGLLSQLKVDRTFGRAGCLGRFAATPASLTLPTPALGDGYYYLVRGISSCTAQGYGDSTLVPDPRDALDALPICP